MAERKLKVMALGKTAVRLMGLFNPLMKELVEMHYLQKTPVLLEDHALSNLIRPVKKTPYDEGLRRTLEVYLQKQSTRSA